MDRPIRSVDSPLSRRAMIVGMSSWRILVFGCAPRRIIGGWLNRPFAMQSRMLSFCVPANRCSGLMHIPLSQVWHATTSSPHSWIPSTNLLTSLYLPPTDIIGRLVRLATLAIGCKPLCAGAVLAWLSKINHGVVNDTSEYVKVPSVHSPWICKATHVVESTASKHTTEPTVVDCIYPAADVNLSITRISSPDAA